MRVVTANRRFFDHFGTDREETEGKSLFELGNGQWNIPELRRLLEETTEQRQAFEGYPVEHRFPKIGLRKMLLNGRHLREEDPTQNKILLAIEDVTDRQQVFGSLFETGTWLRKAKNRRLVDQELFAAFNEEIDTAAKLLNGYIRSIGNKFSH